MQASPAIWRWARTVLCALLVSSLCAACGAGLARADGSAVTPFRVTRDADFIRPQEALRRLVLAKHAYGRNEFCVIGQRTAGGYDFAWVYWPRQHNLILWEPGDSGVDDLTTSRRYLDLRRDVVPTPDDIKGSNYLISRPWLDALLQTCHRQGDSFTISVPAPQPGSPHR